MKKFLLTLLVSSGVCATSLQADARGNDHNRPVNYSWLNWGGLDDDIKHLNRMVGHVRWQVSRYHADRSVRRDFAQIRMEVDRVNAKFREHDFDRRRLRREIESLHTRLHDLEVRLRVRHNDFYHWR